MNDDPDRDLPLHAEAKARSRWRGGETILAKGGEGESLPASEVDDGAAAEPAAGGQGTAPGSIVPPPD